MTQNFPRVAALDNEKDELSAISVGLGQAGFWAMPFLFDAGELVPSPPQRALGIRLIFSDIHILAGNMSITQHVNAILTCIKKIIKSGPYGIIFWSKYPDEAKSAWAELLDRCSDHDVEAPVCYGLIDKNKVLDSTTHTFDAQALSNDINDVIRSCPTLALTMAWDDRVALAAINTTNRLYQMAVDSKPQPGESTAISAHLAHIPKWNALLSFLAAAAVGDEQAEKSPLYALDNALLPIVEDQLYSASLLETKSIDVPDEFRGSSLSDHIKEKGSKDRMGAASAAELNTLYLIENEISSSLDCAARGVVSKIIEADGEIFKGIFGKNRDELIASEFFMDKTASSAQAKSFLTEIVPCLVTLVAECDEVQNKVWTFRYLLGILIKNPESQDRRPLYYSSKKKEFSNDSIYSLGNIRLKGEGHDSLLLVSCSRFLATHSRNPISCTPAFRLRRPTLDELLHRYTVHARRPGVMRFFS